MAAELIKLTTEAGRQVANVAEKAAKEAAENQWDSVVVIGFYQGKIVMHHGGVNSTKLLGAIEHAKFRLLMDFWQEGDGGE